MTATVCEYYYWDWWILNDIEIALRISSIAVVSNIASPETVSLSSLQFQESHNTNELYQCFIYKYSLPPISAACNAFSRVCHWSARIFWICYRKTWVFEWRVCKKCNQKLNRFIFVPSIFRWLQSAPTLTIESWNSLSEHWFFINTFNS